MNFNNATYDVLWQVPDGGLNSTGVPCCSIHECKRYCQNSSWPPFGGSWSMYPNMKTATRRAEGYAMGGWTLEIAFPLHPKDGKGGLLSAGFGSSLPEKYDPTHGAKYWSVDFSRAEHPFFTSNSSLFGELCPIIQQQQPTLLGTDQWSCYWEWVWQSLGGLKYMHNPDRFGFLQFAGPGEEEVCGNVEWPARYVLAQVYQAEVAYVTSMGRYTSDVWSLIRGGYCSIYNGCNSTRLAEAATIYANMYNLRITVDNKAVSCVKYATSSESSNYTGGPCFQAHVYMPRWQVRASIREDRYLKASSSGGCLPSLQPV